MADWVEEQIVKHEWTGNVDNISYGQIIIRCKDCYGNRNDGFCHNTGLHYGEPIEVVRIDWDKVNAYFEKLSK